MATETSTIAGMTPSGRRIAAPALDLVELVASNGLKHLAMVHHEAWRGHPLISADLQERLGFMEQPQSSGIARLVAHEPESGTFVYPSGTVWTVGEVVRTFADNGSAAGVKAGLELCYLAAESLVEASEAAQVYGGHGNVNPYTLVIKGDGQPLILGYGLPQVELLAWREDNRVQLVEDSLRYAPPERLEGRDEEPSSDLFSLALVGLELMVGRPVYDGVLADVKQQATRGEGMRRLYQWREKLPQNVREVLGRALKPDPDTRFPRGLEFVYAVHDLLGSIDVEGPSLTEVMAKVRASQKRGKALKGGQTAMLSAEEMAEMAADLREFEDKPLPPPRRPRPEEGAAPDGEKPRWQKVVRQTPAGSADDPRQRRDAPSGSRPETLDTPIRRSGVGVAPPKGSTLMAEPAPARAAPTSTGRTSTEPPPGQVSREEVRERLVRRLRAEPRVSGPDDLDPDDVVPADTGKVPPADASGRPRAAFAGEPPPSPPTVPPADPGPTTSGDGEDTGIRAKTAAAALLERMRTSGDRRRRLRSSSAEPNGAPSGPGSGPTSASAPGSSVGSSGPAPGGSNPGPPGPTSGPGAGSGAGGGSGAGASASPEAPSGPRAAPPPPPPPASLRTVTPSQPTDAQRAVAIGPGEPLSRRTVEVALGRRTARVPWLPEELPAGLVMRAVPALGGWPIEPTGRLLAGFRATAHGAPLPPDQPVQPGAAVVLERVPADTRMVDLVVRAAQPEIRLRTPLSLATPTGWLLAGLREWLGLTGEIGLVVGGRRADPDLLLADALGDATTAEVAAIPRSAGGTPNP